MILPNIVKLKEKEYDLNDNTQREKYVIDLLKYGIINYRKNSQSIEYPFFDNIDKHEDGTDKRFFELSDLYKIPEILPLISTFIINSKKGIGKTYQMRKLMEEATNNNEYFTFIRRLKEDIKEQKQDWEDLASDGFPFKIHGSRIIRIEDNKTVGNITTISTLYNQTGKEFTNYKYILFDEFRDKRGIARYIPDEFKKFVKFTFDLQRSKPEIKIFMFANNETNYCPYTKGLRIDSDNDYFIDLEQGVFYVNLKNKFKGAITNTSAGYRLAKYDKELLDELDNNTAVYGNEETNLLPFSKSKIDGVKYQFRLNKRLYVFGFNREQQIAIIKSIRQKDAIPNKITYAMTTTDYITGSKTVRHNDVTPLVKTWYNLLAYDKLFFENIDDKLDVERFIEQVIGKVLRKPKRAI